MLQSEPSTPPNQREKRVGNAAEKNTMPDQLRALTKGLPHSLILINSNGEPNILLPLDRVPRPRSPAHA